MTLRLEKKNALSEDRGVAQRPPRKKKRKIMGGRKDPSRNPRSDQGVRRGCRLRSGFVRLHDQDPAKRG